MATFTPLLDILADVPDPRRAQGKLYKLPHVLLISILAIVSGSDSYRGIVTFIDTHRRTLNRSFRDNRRAGAGRDETVARAVPWKWHDITRTCS